jgi:hypothetical protein
VPLPHQKQPMAKNGWWRHGAGSLTKRNGSGGVELVSGQMEWGGEDLEGKNERGTARPLAPFIGWRREAKRTAR